jgi:hypothetical protein
LEDWRKGWSDPSSGQPPYKKPPPTWDFFFFAEGFPDSQVIPERTVYFWELLQAIIEETRDEAEAYGAQYGVFLIPSVAQVDPAAYEEDVSSYAKKWDLSVTTWATDSPNTAMTEMLDAKRVPVLDLLSGFVAHTEGGGAPLYYANNRHFTPEGHREAAELLCDWMIEGRLVGP